MRTPADALLAQVPFFLRTQLEWRRLIRVMDRATDLSRCQWTQLAAFALDFRPDTIVELGRGYGNSTAMFLEVCAQTGGRLVSMCRSDAFERERLGKPESWFAKGDIRVCEITEQTVEVGERVFVFWDAHGFEVAEWVLAYLMPLIANKPHLVVMHDVSDVRYNGARREYTGPIWKGEIGEREFQLGNLFSKVPQAISALEFTTRNRVQFHAAETSLVAMTPGQLAECRRLGDLFELTADWHWFSLNEAPGPYVFPHRAVAKAA